MIKINILKSIIPPFWIYYKNFLFSKKESVFVQPGNNIYIFLAANYGNLGDVAITVAQHNILCEMFPNYNIVEIPANCSYGFLKGVISKIRKDDLITFVGGGNMGDLYPLYENIRQIVVSLLPENKIIQFPVTVDFSETRIGNMMMNYATRIYRKHNQFKIMARERKSAMILSNMLNTEIHAIPEIVLTLNADNLFYKSNRKGIALCLRNDKESSIGSKAKMEIESTLLQKGFNVDLIDTTVDDETINLNNKELVLRKCLDKFSQYKLVITDRLHGMIFSYITGTPCIVFPNSNNKTRNCYEWIKESGYVFFMDSFDILQFQEKVKTLSWSYPNLTDVSERRRRFVEMIHKEIL